MRGFCLVHQMFTEQMIVYMSNVVEVTGVIKSKTLKINVEAIWRESDAIISFNFMEIKYIKLDGVDHKWL